MRRAGPRRARPPAPGALVDAVRDRHLGAAEHVVLQRDDQRRRAIRDEHPRLQPLAPASRQRRLLLPLDDGAHPRPGRLQLALVLLLGGGGPRIAGVGLGSREPRACRRRLLDRILLEARGHVIQRLGLERPSACPRRSAAPSPGACAPCPRRAGPSARPGVWRAPAGTASVARHPHVSPDVCLPDITPQPGGACWTGRSVKSGRGAAGGWRVFSWCSWRPWEPRRSRPPSSSLAGSRTPGSPGGLFLARPHMAPLAGSTACSIPPTASSSTPSTSPPL